MTSIDATCLIYCALWELSASLIFQYGIFQSAKSFAFQIGNLVEYCVHLLYSEHLPQYDWHFLKNSDQSSVRIELTRISGEIRDLNPVWHDLRSYVKARGALFYTFCSRYKKSFIKFLFLETIWLHLFLKMNAVLVLRSTTVQSMARNMCKIYFLLFPQ